ncbi:hypothetical protein AB0I35_32030 [Nocardia sp. NPDC050378]|uniref:hypothetical protein n=1 Tax=Nocardia sp. NPDC050378 TaxID=3155400 RepID=UPI003408DACE
MEWAPTVCGFQSGADVPTGGVSELLPGAAVSAACTSPTGKTVLTASYLSDSALDADIARHDHSTYVTGQDGNGLVWLLIIRDEPDAAPALHPLEQFGFRFPKS